MAFIAQIWPSAPSWRVITERLAMLGLALSTYTTIDGNPFKLRSSTRTSEGRIFSQILRDVHRARVARPELGERTVHREV